MYADIFHPYESNVGHSGGMGVASFLEKSGIFPHIGFSSRGKICPNSDMSDSGIRWYPDWIFAPANRNQKDTQPDYRAMDLRGANLSKHSFRGADFGDTNMSGANISFADFSGAYMAGADLSHVDAGGANLRYINAYGSNLRESSLMNARLEGAVLENADMRGANLSLAHVNNANFENADLRGANISGARGWESANLTNAKMTAWPRHATTRSIAGHYEDVGCIPAVSPRAAGRIPPKFKDSKFRDKDYDKSTR